MVAFIFVLHFLLTIYVVFKVRKIYSVLYEEFKK